MDNNECKRSIVGVYEQDYITLTDGNELVHRLSN